MDGLVPIEVPRPSTDGSVIMESVTNAKMPNWVRPLIEEYLDKVTLRKAEQVHSGDEEGENEDAVRAKVEKVIRSRAEPTAGRGTGIRETSKINLIDTYS